MALSTGLFVDISGSMNRSVAVVGRQPEYQKKVAAQCLAWIAEYANLFDARHLISCFDGYSTWREEEYPFYKSTRREAKKLRDVNEPTARACVPTVKAAMQAVGFKYIHKSKFEADDLLVTGARLWARQPKQKAIIVSMDKDIYQGVGDGVSQYRPGTSQMPAELVTEKTIQEKFGLTPEQYRSHQILIGDKTDDVPKLLTPAVAKKIVLEHGNVANWLNSTAEGRKFGKANRDKILANVELITMSYPHWEDLQPAELQIDTPLDWERRLREVVGYNFKGHRHMEHLASRLSGRTLFRTP